MINNLPRTSRLFLAAFVFLFASLLGLSILSSEASQKNNPTLINKLSAFDVVQLRMHEGLLFFSFRNGYNKNITAYAVGIGKHSKYKEDFIYSEIDSVIPPGAFYERSIPIYSSRNSHKPREFTILAVIFDDNTSDGDTKTIQDIKQERLGEKIQFKRAVTVLEDHLRLSDTDLQVVLQGDLTNYVMNSLDPSRVDILTALKELEPLDESGDPDATIKLPKYVSAGLKTAKESIQYKLQELETYKLYLRGMVCEKVFVA
jgi:hypothetical protein